MTAEERRFWAKVKRSPDCWEWQGNMQGTRANNRYGRFYLTKQKVRPGKKPTTAAMSAHRYAWQSAHGAIPNGADILHSCDNGRCVNPAHLSPGSKSKNTTEMHERGRGPLTRLSPEKVKLARQLYAEGWLVKKIASRLRVSRQTAGRAIHRKSWSQV